MNDIERWRNRLNTAILVLPGQWFGLMAYYWLRYYPPLKPYHFEVAFPVTAFLIGFAVSCAPFFLPKVYFIPRKFEQGMLYRRLGLRWFRYLTTDGDLVNRLLRRIEPSYRAIHNRAALRKHLDGTYANEQWHLSFFIAGTLTACHAFHTRQHIIGSFIMLTNVIFNLLPVLHQRYKRARLRRFIMDGARGDSSAEAQLSRRH